MCRCHGFRAGFKVPGGAIVEQIHNLGVDALVRDIRGTWCCGRLAWSLGCVEADLADDPGTIPAGAKPRPNRDSLTIAMALEQCQTRFWSITNNLHASHTGRLVWRGHSCPRACIRIAAAVCHSRRFPTSFQLAARSVFLLPSPHGSPLDSLALRLRDRRRPDFRLHLLRSSQTKR